MKVCFQCGYYSDLAHKNLIRRPEDYWDAYFYVWAVKIGSFKKSFYYHNEHVKIQITAKNFGTVRPTFGEYVVHCIDREGTVKDLLLIAVPSKDGIVGVQEYRTLRMLRESVANTKFAANCSNALQWVKKLPKAHEGGARNREMLRALLSASPTVKGRNVVLVDDLLSTGGSLLASHDCLTGAGANVLGAVTCGRTIYDFNTPPFGDQNIMLENELSDFSKTIAGRA